jgi:tripeptidyl-peptidase-1
MLACKAPSSPLSVARARVDPEVAADFSGGGLFKLLSPAALPANSSLEYLRHIGTKYAGLFKCVLPALGQESHEADRYLSRIGRAYPDISAQALNFPVVVNGTVEYIEGTSCSSPVYLYLTTSALRSSSPCDRLQQASSPS